jgi:hypothetical protein
MEYQADSGELFGESLLWDQMESFEYTYQNTLLQKTILPNVGPPSMNANLEVENGRRETERGIPMPFKLKNSQLSNQTIDIRSENEILVFADNIL